VTALFNRIVMPACAGIHAGRASRRVDGRDKPAMTMGRDENIRRIRGRRMRRVILPGTNLAASRFAFGTASLFNAGPRRGTREPARCGL